jgi:hypothetical protein
MDVREEQELFHGEVLLRDVFIRWFVATFYDPGPIAERPVPGPRQEKDTIRTGSAWNLCLELWTTVRRIAFQDIDIGSWISIVIVSW